MNVWIVLAVVVIPVIMLVLQKVWARTCFLFNVLAFISTVIFGSITAEAIYSILETNEVFMTTIHGIFLNPFFLVTGAYLGWYILYRLLFMIINN